MAFSNQPRYNFNWIQRSPSGLFSPQPDSIRTNAMHLLDLERASVGLELGLKLI